MWQGFNQLANAVKEHAESATRDLGLDSQLETARKVASGLLLDASPSKAESQGVDARGQGRHYTEAVNGGAEGATSHYPQQVVRSEPDIPRWHGSDSGGFDEVPLGSPPLKTTSADRNGRPPHLDKVVHSLRAYSKAEAGPQDTAAAEAFQLRTENASLKQRLSAIENEAADVFGELEDLRDRLQASEQARLATETSRPSPKGKNPDSHAADRQDLSESLHVLKADLQAQKEAAEDAQREAARSMKDVKIAQEITKQVQEEMSSKLQMAAAERETLLQRLQAVQHSAQPSAEDMGLEEKVAAVDEAMDWKARATKLKRQALTYKTKFSEAAAARDTALAELQALKEERTGIMPLASGGDYSTSIEEKLDVRQQLEDLQKEHASRLSQQQSTAEMLQGAKEDNNTLTGELRSATSHLRNLQEEREALLQEQASWSGQLQHLQWQLQSQGGAKLELQQACQGQKDLVGQLQTELAAAQHSLESLQDHVGVITAERESAVAKAAAASELQAGYEQAAQHLEELQRQLYEEQRLHELHLAEATSAHQSLQAEAHANMQHAEEDRRLALRLAEERLQEIQALRADLQKVAEVPVPLPAPAVQSTAPPAALAHPANGGGLSKAEQCTADPSSIAGTIQPEGTVQSNPLFSPSREAPVDAAPYCEAPSALPSRKPGAAMRKIKELQTALNRKDIELVAVQAQLQAALDSAQGRQQADEGQDSEKGSAPEQPTHELDTLLKEKQTAEAECSRLQKDISELTASLEKESKGHMNTQEELRLVRGRLSTQTAETQAALEGVQTLTAELETARDQALQLQQALNEANKRVQAQHAVAESARSQIEEASAAAQNLKQQKTELQERLASLQRDLDRKEKELCALRDGSVTESGLASAALSEAQSRAADAETAAASALETAEAAQRAMQEAQEQATSSLGGANERYDQAQELCRQRETELAEARLEADALRGALDAERAAADAAATALTGTLEQQHAADKATALGDAMVGYRQQLHEQREQLEKKLTSQSVQLEDASAKVQQLESDLKGAKIAAEGHHAGEGVRMQAVLQESEQLRQQLVQAVSELQAAQQEASEALAAARERQKRFTMLNATFRRKEEALVGRAEQAEAASSQAVSDSAEAKLMAAQAKQEADSMQKLVERLESEARAASDKHSAAEKARDSAEKAADDASAELVNLQLELQTLRAAYSRAQATAEDFDQRVAAAVAVREEELVEQGRAAEEAVQHAREEMQRAEVRSAAAEAAKIELSLRLAAALSEQEVSGDISAVPSASARDSKQSPEEAVQRMEELELAASVASRRASAAEGQLHHVKQQLELADKRAKELAWQQMSDGSMGKRGFAAPDVIEMLGTLKARGLPL